MIPSWISKINKIQYEITGGTGIVEVRSSHTDGVLLLSAVCVVFSFS
jgi:hypothetical protein